MLLPSTLPRPSLPNARGIGPFTNKQVQAPDYPGSGLFRVQFLCLCSPLSKFCVQPFTSRLRFREANSTTELHPRTKNDIICRKGPGVCRGVCPHARYVACTAARQSLGAPAVHTSSASYSAPHVPIQQRSCGRSAGADCWGRCCFTCCQHIKQCRLAPTLCGGDLEPIACQSAGKAPKRETISPIPRPLSRWVDARRKSSDSGLAQELPIKSHHWRVPRWPSDRNVASPEESLRRRRQSLPGPVRVQPGP